VTDAVTEEGRRGADATLGDVMGDDAASESGHPRMVPGSPPSVN